MKEILFEVPKKFPGAPASANAEGNVGPLSLRTFRADLEKMSQREEITRMRAMTADAALRAEHNEGHPEDPHHDGRLRKFILILSLAFAFAVGVGAYVLIGTGNGAETAEVESVDMKKPDLERPSTEILVSDSPREQIVADIQIFFRGSGGDPKKSIAGFVVNDTEGERSATAGEFLSAIGLSNSHALLRSLEDPFVFGVYPGGDDGERAGYVILRSRSPKDTFAGLFLAEPRLAGDLIPVVNPLIPREEHQYLFAKQFRDKRVSGLDVRFVGNISGTPVLLYAEAPQSHFIIAGSERALDFALETVESD